MLIYAIVSFLIAAVAGIYMAVRIFQNQTPPWLVTGVHGVLAATGLGLVIFAVITGTDSNPVLIGLGLLVVAALGGFYLFSFHLREEPHPKAVVVLHAGLAVAGVGALLVTFI